MKDKSKDTRTLFSILAGRNVRVLTIIVMGHLLIEYHINLLLADRRIATKGILKKSFSRKIEYLYPTWLPLFLFKNIKLFNKIRNEIVHNLGTVDRKLVIYMQNGELKTLKIPSRKNKDKFYFNELISTILFDLVNYSHYSLRIMQNINLDQIFRLKK